MILVCNLYKSFHCRSLFPRAFCLGGLIFIVFCSGHYKLTVDISTFFKMIIVDISTIVKISTTLCYNFFMKLGNLIKELRIDNEYSQQTVANKLGISRSVLSQYENNLVEPTAYVIKKFAEFFNVSTDYLLGLVDEFGTPLATPTSENILTSEERSIIYDYRALNSECQKLVKSTIKTLLISSLGNEHNKNRYS